MLVGYGVVGRGVAKVLNLKQSSFIKKGVKFKIVAMCEKDGSIFDPNGLSLKELDNFKKHRSFTTETALKLIPEIEADILIEVTPTNIINGEPGYSHIVSALKSGKHVVTSNKGPLALYYNKLMHIAEKHDRKLLFEATVCSSTPVFSLVRKTLQPNDILSIVGILNGTTNYILTKMHEEDISFDTALREACEMGYAEANASYDVDAIDPAAKLVILANALMGMKIKFADVKKTGIREITPEAVELAKSRNRVIKLVGEVSDSTVEVSPRLVPASHPLNVGGTLNALMFRLDLAHDLYIVGRGAGQIETASAIISDMLDICGCL